MCSKTKLWVAEVSLCSFGSKGFVYVYLFIFFSSFFDRSLPFSLSLSITFLIYCCCHSVLKSLHSRFLLGHSLAQTPFSLSLPLLSLPPSLSLSLSLSLGGGGAAEHVLLVIPFWRGRFVSIVHNLSAASWSHVVFFCCSVRLLHSHTHRHTHTHTHTHTHRVLLSLSSSSLPFG